MPLISFSPSACYRSFHHLFLSLSLLPKFLSFISSLCLLPKFLSFISSLCLLPKFLSFISSLCLLPKFLSFISSLSLLPKFLSFISVPQLVTEVSLIFFLPSSCSWSCPSFISVPQLVTEVIPHLFQSLGIDPQVVKAEGSCVRGNWTLTSNEGLHQKFL